MTSAGGDTPVPRATNPPCTLRAWSEDGSTIRTTWIAPSDAEDHLVPLLDQAAEGYLFLQLDRFTETKPRSTIASRRLTFTFPGGDLRESLKDEQKTVWVNLINWHEESVRQASRIQSENRKTHQDHWRQLLADWAVQSAPTAAKDSIRFVIQQPGRLNVIPDDLRSDRLAHASFKKLRELLDPSASPSAMPRPWELLLSQLTDNETDPDVSRGFPTAVWRSARQELDCRRDEGQPDPMPSSAGEFSDLIRALAADHQRRNTVMLGTTLAGPSQTRSGRQYSSPRMV